MVRMSRWDAVVPRQADPLVLPSYWRLVHQTDNDTYMIVGRTDPEEAPSAVLEVRYASGDDLGDLRVEIGSLITLGISRVVRKRQHQI